ncbi:hypothetical protein OB905_04415 [Halobacteria archaeon AArc-dxtr1]|nr:hypothetical protein [Halobacteria archaeon AArc-dxtr1]
MANSTTDTTQTGDTRGQSRLRTTVVVLARLLLDAAILGLWVLLLALLFLSTGWPGWAFYALLLFGVGLYVSLTSTWGRPREIA